MAKPNYQFAKRQRDLAKKQKKEEKLQRKSEANNSLAADQTNASIVPGDSRGAVDDNEERNT